MIKRFLEAVEKHRELILQAERFIWQHPETGYKEIETSKYMEEAFEGLGYEIVRAEGITGFYTCIDTKRPGPTVLVLGELDAVLCPSHKEANPETGAVHSCGHHAQCAALLGLAAALAEPNILDGFCGKIKLCAVPAEELLEIEFRRELKKQGKIRYFSGKGEFLSRGYFDDVEPGVNSGSTDMGELSCVMPVIHPYAGGAIGTCHGSDYYIIDPEAACVSSAKWQLVMLWLLLRSNAERANKIIRDFQPMFTSTQEYLEFVDRLNDEGDRIIYCENGKAEVRID